MKALLLAAAIIAPGQDLAQEPTTKRSLRIAGAFWQKWPACERRVEAAQIDVSGLATLGPNRGVCRMWLSLDRWFGPDGKVAPENRRSYCETVVHEWGHWLGFDHAGPDRLGSIMRPALEGYKVPGCRVYRWPTKRRATKGVRGETSGAVTPRRG